jgi:hypothetical protein
MAYELYRSLRLPDNSIRILTLVPGTEEEEIRCQMRCAALSDRPRYSAVSYMWGPSDERRTVWVNERRIYVRKNLWSALQRLRLRTQDRKLWIDAICIDQSDGVERSRQVELMREIFEQAKCVLVWLGDASKTSNRAFEILENSHAFHHVPSAYLPVDTEAGFDSLERIPNSSFSVEVQMALGLAALAELCQREYWGRTWIIQEIVLAQELELFCGSRSVPWSSLARITEFGNGVQGDSLTRLTQLDYELPDAEVSKYTNPTTGDQTSTDIQHISLGEQIQDAVRAITTSMPVRLHQERRDRQNRKSMQDHQGPSLQVLVRKYRDSSCADPRDKVFALLGLVEIQSKGRKILPSYWRSVYQVYVDVMECCSDVAIVDRLDFGTMVQDMFGLSRLNVDEYLRAQFLGYLTSESLLLLRSRCLGREQANSTILVQLGILSEARLLPPLRHETYRNATGLRYLPPRMIWAEDPGGRRRGFACQDARRGDLVCKSELSY